ncbi:MAG TPA: hypothetical protein VEC14_06675 [Reyranellaceae bacterium]|nr:hypothetical protein [Reyranellaceae bacterium]
MVDNKAAIDFGLAAVAIENECPRGECALDHLVDLVHVRSFPNSPMLHCVDRRQAPVELREFLTHPTLVQLEFWSAHHHWKQHGRQGHHPS